jgi:hypothetical protein
VDAIHKDRGPQAEAIPSAKWHSRNGPVTTPIHGSSSRVTSRGKQKKKIETNKSAKPGGAHPTTARARLAPRCFRVQERRWRGSVSRSLLLVRPGPTPSPAGVADGAPRPSPPREIAGRALLQLSPRRRSQVEQCLYGESFVSYGVCENYRVQANLFSM